MEAPEEAGVLVTCSYCDMVARTDGEKLVALRAWDSPEDMRAQIAPKAKTPPPPPAPPPPSPMRLSKKAWVSPDTPRAVQLFPPSDPEAAARAASHKAEPEVPAVPVVQQVRPILKFAVPTVAGAALLAAAVFTWAKFSAEKEVEGGARPAAGAAQPAAVDPEAARRAALEESTRAVEKKLAAGEVPGDADVPALVELLSRPDQRLAAIAALGALGGAAAPAVPALLDLLDEPRAGQPALEAACRIAPQSPQLREALTRLLGAEPRGPEAVSLRLSAIVACERIGPGGVTPLGAGLHSSSAEVRDACARALVKIGAPALQVTLSALQSAARPESKSAATGVLESLRNVPLTEASRLLTEVGKHPPADRALFALLAGMGPDVLPFVLEALDAREEKPGEEWWGAAQECLSSLGSGAVPVAREWMEEHRLERARVRKLLFRSAGGWGAEAVPMLVPALSDGDFAVRAAAVEALGQLGPAARDAWEALQNGAVAGELDFRAAAAAVAIRGREAVALLSMLLQAASPETRVAAMQELGALGKASGPAVPDLVVLLPDPQFRAAAFAALEKIGDPSIDALVAALRHDIPEVRTGAAATLAKLGARTPAVPPALASALTDEVKEPREAALRALMAMGPEGVKEFEKGLKHKSRAVRALSVWALGQMGPAAVAALPELRAALKEEGDPHRKAVIKAMARMGAPAVTELSALLRHADAGIREGAAQALGGMGAEAASALPVLKELIADKEPAVQAAAADAVKKLESQ